MRLPNNTARCDGGTCPSKKNCRRYTDRSTSGDYVVNATLWLRREAGSNACDMWVPITKPATTFQEAHSYETQNTIDFRFIGFNPRRLLRGVEAVRVAVIDGEHEDWLWMSMYDIKKNIEGYGQHPELVKALDAYKQGGEL